MIKIKTSKFQHRNTVKRWVYMVRQNLLQESIDLTGYDATKI